MAVTNFDKPVGTEIESLSDQMGSFATTTAITLDSDGNGTISYPSGFTTSNCYIESVKADLGGNVYSNHPNLVVLQRAGDIRIGMGVNFAGASVVMLLHKR